MELSRRYPDADENEIGNGCGPGGWKNKVIPDSILGVNIKPACMIHDVDYKLGETIEDKEVADRTFRNNMIRLIQAKKRAWRWTTRIRMRFANGYFFFVDNFGGPDFWENKEGK